MKKILAILLLLAPNAFAGLCAISNSCDTGTYRDAYENDNLTTFRVQIYIAAKSDSTLSQVEDSCMARMIDSVNARHEADSVQWQAAVVRFYSDAFNIITGTEFLAMKAMYGSNPDSALKIWYVPSTSSSTTVGNVYLGGTNYYPSAGFDASAYVLHEEGHTFGLEHTHAYVAPNTWGDSLQDCDSCYETVHSDPGQDAADWEWKGDHMPDTDPDPWFNADGTPRIEVDSCSDSAFANTTGNYMSYWVGLAADSLATNFTTNQRSCVHCYLQEVYPGWIVP